MKTFKKVFGSVVVLSLVLSLFGLIAPTIARAATAPNLGVAAGYSVFGKAGVTNNSEAGTTHVWGNVGGNNFGVTNLSDANQVAGTIDAGANVPVADALTAAYGDLAAVGQGATTPLDLDGGGSVGPGLYDIGAAGALNGTLTLTGAGVYIFRSQSSTSVSGTGTMSLLGGATACNVFWQIPTAMTIDSAAHMEGTIIAGSLISFVSGASLVGRAWAGTQVTMINNIITEPTCAAAPILTLVKTITNDNGGARPLADFQLTATGPTNITGVSATGPVTSATVTAGTYTLSEITHSDYTAGLWTCTNGITVTNSQITLANGNNTTCTINNNDIAPQLHLRKLITLDNGGTATVANFTLTADGTGANDISGTSPVDSGPGLLAGTFALSETSPSGYTASAWVCVGGTQVGSNITVGINQSATCTITNDDAAPVLHLRKIVDNTGGGTAIPTAWILTAAGTGGSPTNLTGTTPVDSIGTFKADTYTLAESGGSSGYTASLYSCVKNGGGAVLGNSIILALGDTATCTITNNATQGLHDEGTINVVKTVINDNGQTKTVADFPLFVNGALVVSGVTNIFHTNGGVYTVTETSDPHYTRTFSGDCNVNGQLNLNPGENKFCIITNNDIGAPIVPLVPPLIDVVKVPSPLALPGGTGPVIYTYTLKNIGTVPVTNITMVGDTCSPIILVSGDSNNDTKLGVNETWIYTCSTILSATHTNIVTTTGWANGISAVDIASATVVVGAPIVPPLIHVTKIPSPLTLLAGGGTVTYTEKVTNPGTVALSNVSLSDDKCTPVAYVSGDTNGNSLLDTTETWNYTCATNLTQTTTNTVTAVGSANGLTARDFAIATVVVAVPKLPNTGFAPIGQITAQTIALLVGLLLVITNLLIVLFRKVRA